MPSLQNPTTRASAFQRCEQKSIFSTQMPTATTWTRTGNGIWSPISTYLAWDVLEQQNCSRGCSLLHGVYDGHEAEGSINSNPANHKGGFVVDVSRWLGTHFSSKPVYPGVVIKRHKHEFAQVGANYQVKRRGSSRWLNTFTSTTSLVLTSMSGPGNSALMPITCITHIPSRPTVSSLPTSDLILKSCLFS